MKRKSIKERIKNYFLINPTAELRVRQIERVIKVPLPSAIKYAKELTKEHILLKKEKAGINFYTAQRSSPQFLLEKKVFNIQQIVNSGLIDYLKKEYGNPIIILFGSFSKGEDIESSDIDLYIETAKKRKFNLNKFEKKLNRNIQIFNQISIKKISNPHLANNIINGITLNGFLEIFK